jgi:hypothetical protein
MDVLMNPTKHFVKKVRSLILAGIILAAFTGQSLMSASVGAAQWQTSTSTVPERPGSTGTPSQEHPAGLLITIAPIATSTRTPTPISLGNFIWDDLDADGVQDAGEPGVSGVTVQLWNSAKSQLLDTDVTNATGNYTLIAPVSGNYRIRVVLPTAADLFSPKLQGGDVTRDSNVNSSGVDLGFTDIISIASNVISISNLDAGLLVFKTPTPTRTPTPINLGNFVWDDLDADGLQDAGEPGVSGVTVQLWNSAKSQLLDTDVTNATGNYTLIAPVSGNYRIRVVLPTSADLFSPKLQGGDVTRDSNVNPSGVDLGFTDVISIASNVISISSLDAGLIVFKTPTPTRTPTPINVGNFVWDDLDADGVQDAGEPGVAGVMVQLWNSAKSQLLDSEITNASGNYWLIAPIPGNYRIRVVLPTAGDMFSPKSQGVDVTKDSNINPGGEDSASLISSRSLPMSFLYPA